MNKKTKRAGAYVIDKAVRATDKKVIAGRQTKAARTQVNQLVRRVALPDLDGLTF